MNHSLVMLRESWASSNPGESGGYWIARFRACEIIRPHPEERRFLAARLEGWPQAQQCLLPSFETAAQEGGLLRMRLSISSHVLGGQLHRRSTPRPRCSRPGRRRSLFERLNQFHVGLFDRAERNVPSIRLVPGELREIGAQRVILKIPASAGENFVANNDELIGGEAL